MPGPAPKPDDVRRRRNAPLANTVKLPPEGRQGDAPAWPIGGEEPAIWAEIWATPQAAAWERLGWTRVVARYCRIVAAAEHPDATAAIMAQASTLEDRLGLTPMSILRLRWEIASDEVAERREKTPAPAKTTARRRLKVADGGLAGA